MIVQQSPPCLIAYRGSAARRIDNIGEQDSGQNAVKIGRRTRAMSCDKLLDVTKQRLHVAKEEKVILTRVFDEFGIRYLRRQLATKLDGNLSIPSTMEYKCRNLY